MNLLHLAPDIQEEILFLPPAEPGRAVLTEKQVRRVAAEMDWRKQRRMWDETRPDYKSKLNMRTTP